MRTRSFDDIYEGPVEKDIEVRPPLTVRGKRYRLTQFNVSDESRNEAMIQAAILDSDDEETGVALVNLSGTALAQMITAPTLDGETLKGAINRIAMETLKAKGKIDPDAEKM